RDFYQKARGVNASAALVKATLINSAVDMFDENNDGANDNDFPIPNVHEGWGRINLVNATDGTAQFVDNAAGIATGGSASYAYSAGGGSPLKISLVWSDYPSTAAAAANLVNNLNLTVTSPSGTVYRGNVFSGGWSNTGGSADGVNNVENVYIASAASGTWTVTVSGANVPNGPQPFALVVDGAGAGTAPTATPTATSVATATPTSTSVATATPTSTPTATPGSSLPAAPSNLTASTSGRTQIILSWADNSSNESGFRIERCTGSGCSNFAEIGTVGANVTSATNKGLSKNTWYSYRIRAYNASGNSGYSNTVSIKTP
ncbi:MAG TPA: fibronectin type III domain-containing protein, partial [Roseiflexaceae bacterium]|nr:fibronectin type III domain-containing protein [Roseiflexaceae bacterium]